MIILVWGNRSEQMDNYLHDGLIQFVIRNAPGCKFDKKDAGKYPKKAYELQSINKENLKTMSTQELAKYADPIAIYNTHNNPELIVERINEGELKSKLKEYPTTINRKTVCSMAYICVHRENIPELHESIKLLRNRLIEFQKFGLFSHCKYIHRLMNV